MLNPSPEGTRIRITVHHASASFTALGKVVFVFPNVGMGVVFTNVEEDQLAVLRKWLSEWVVAKSEAPLQGPGRSNLK